jgi:hypothetical protein
VPRALAALTLTLSALVLAAGCGGSDSDSGSTAAAKGEVLSLRTGGALVGVDSASGERRFALPPGLLSADGKRYVTAERAGGATVLHRYDGRTGTSVGTTKLTGAWRLGSVSADGGIAVLAASDGPRTRVQVVGPGAERQRLSLPGTYEIDAVDTYGTSLFLIQRLGEERYAVRLYDLTEGRLHPGSIRPKNEDEEMVGVAGSQVGTPDGTWLLTLYVNTEEGHAFVHALNLRERFALCLDLPSEGASIAALRRYALALPRSGAEVFAANPSLGVAARVGLRELGSVQRLELGATSREPGVAAVSGDGRMLWVSSGRRLTGLDTGSSRRVGPVVVAGRVEALVFRRDGDLLAVGAAGVTALDPITGVARGA